MAIETLALIRSLPPLPKLGPHPGDVSEACGRRPVRLGGPGVPATRRLAWRGRSWLGGVDPRILHRVTALLAKAESTTYRRGRGADRQGAELMTRHAIDVAAVEAERGGGARASGRRIGIDDPTPGPESHC